MCLFTVFIFVCLVAILDAQTVADKPMECSSEFSYSPGEQNASGPVGVNIFINLTDLQVPNYPDKWQGLEVTSSSNGTFNVSHASTDGSLNSGQSVEIHSPVCISFKALENNDSNFTASCYQHYNQHSHLIAARLLHTVIHPQLQLSVNGSEWMNVCHEEDRYHDTVMAMICSDLGYDDAAEYEPIQHESDNFDSLILQCPIGSSRITNCTAEIGRCKSDKVISLTCNANPLGPFDISWSVFTISLTSATGFLFFMLMVSLSVHICKCCRRQGHSEVLVTYVNKDKSSFRRGQSVRSRTADADILSQLPTISYDDVDKDSPCGDFRREKEFRSSAEVLYMDIPDCTFIQSKGKSDMSVDQMYQVDEEGYAKPRNVIGGTTSVRIPEIGPITDYLIGHVDKPMKKPKPTPIPRSRKEGKSSTDEVE